MTDRPSEAEELPYLVGRAWTVGTTMSAEQILHDRAVQASGAAPDSRTTAAAPEAGERPAPGDFLVASARFDGGPDAAAAARTLRQAGIAAVIAPRFVEGFFDAALAVGLPALAVEETLAIKAGDRLRVDVEGHKVVNLSSGDRYVIRNVGDEDLELLRVRACGAAAAASREPAP